MCCQVEDTRRVLECSDRDYEIEIDRKYTFPEVRGGAESPVLLTRGDVCTALVMYCLQPSRLKPFEEYFMQSAVVAMDISSVGAGFLNGGSAVLISATNGAHMCCTTGGHQSHIDTTDH